MLFKFFKSKAVPPAARADDPIQMIGQATLASVRNPGGKVLLYAEVEDGVISADIFSRASDEGVQFRFAPAALKSLIYSFWEAEADPSRRWATLALIIEGGRFDANIEYRDALLEEEDLHERRPKVVSAHFGDAAVDYSSPQ